MTISIHFPAADVHFTRHIEAESLMLSCKKVIVEYKEVGIFACFYGTLFIFNAKLFCSVYRISQQHFLNTHFFLNGREYLVCSYVFGSTALLGDLSCHSDLHAEIGAPCHKIAVGNIIA